MDKSKGLLQTIREGGNTITYSRDSKLNLGNIKDIFNDLFNRRVAPSPYYMNVGLDQFNLMTMQFEYSVNPTQELKAKMDTIYANISISQFRIRIRNESYFIKQYGIDLFSFVKSISDKDAFQKEYMDWNIRTDYDSDDSYDITLHKGKFNYVLSSCGGYAGRTVLEENISRDRVVELLNSKQL